MLQTPHPLRRLLLIAALLQAQQLFAQALSGRVTNEDNEPLIGASVFWLGTDVGTIANQQGFYEIMRANESNRMLIASFVGHISDTVLLKCSDGRQELQIKSL